MNRHELIKAIEVRQQDTLVRNQDTMDNYNMGLITFGELSNQLIDINVYHRSFVENAVDICMEEEQVSYDFIKGFLAHAYITI